MTESCGCPHSYDWHGLDGCGFPGCPCRSAPRQRRPRTVPAATITRCSVCNRRVDAQGSNHAVGCERRGQGPNAVERPTRKQPAITPAARRARADADRARRRGQ